ncbi:hypothetical protein Q5752_007088 [Cryptotrichosporon argae]
MPVSTQTSARPRVTVLGSGVVGLTCALELSSTADVTIVARDMPGDPDSLAWASPWAGAMFLGVDGSSPAQQAMQAESFRRLWQLAEDAPESSATRIGVYDYVDMHDDPAALWYRHLMPNVEEIPRTNIKSGLGSGLKYTSVVVTPGRYLPWLRAKLERAGVRFVRADVASLAEAGARAPCDALVNATGNGARFLLDVGDAKCVQVRGQTMLVKSTAPDIHIRHAVRWDEYTYVLPRGDGTAILGGIKEFGSVDPNIDENLKRAIHKRCHAMLPEHVPAKFEDLEIVRDLLGIRPEREGGTRVEAETLDDGLKVVHAYGVTGGGYVYSYGIAAQVKKLVAAML